MKLKILRRLKRTLGVEKPYTSETSKVRHMVLPFCNGYGCDIGFGGDKIKKDNCVGIDYANPYAYTGNDKVDIACDVMNEPIPVADNSFDYIYTSHLIEDFVDTSKALTEFIRILKPGGNLVLVFPNQKVYEAHCLKTQQPINIHHVHQEMGLDFMIDKLNNLVGIEYNVLFHSDCEIDYNVVLVLQVKKQK